eukprot:TRINITY_DN3431_c0_g1_i9.p2 TRINITY_DN3431_c0_g1~~TRINITY_DN3431_c0_g1_i9.p2  ORF type:complete len:193 (+),score=43.46 TRINITY_DN3431_c0_g1_i9:222-800(+)
MTNGVILFGLYRTCTRLAVGLWALRCVKDGISMRSSEKPSLLDWSSASARRLAKTFALSLPVDLVLMRAAEGRVAPDFLFHHLFCAAGAGAYFKTERGLFYVSLCLVMELYGALSFFETVFRGKRRLMLLLYSWKAAVILLARLPLWSFLISRAFRNNNSLWVCKLSCLPLVGLDGFWLSKLLPKIRALQHL